MTRKSKLWSISLDDLQRKLSDFIQGKQDREKRLKELIYDATQQGMNPQEIARTLEVQDDMIYKILKEERERRGI